MATKIYKGSDNVNHPIHYMGKLEVIDYIEDKLTPEQFEGYLVGNVMKYMSRYQKKNGLEDLKKGSWYLNKLINTLESRQMKEERNEKQE